MWVVERCNRSGHRLGIPTSIRRTLAKRLLQKVCSVQQHHRRPMGMCSYASPMCFLRR